MHHATVSSAPRPGGKTRNSCKRAEACAHRDIRAPSVLGTWAALKAPRGLILCSPKLAGSRDVLAKANSARTGP